MSEPMPTRRRPAARSPPADRRPRRRVRARTLRPATAPRRGGPQAAPSSQPRWPQPSSGRRRGRGEPRASGRQRRRRARAARPPDRRAGPVARGGRASPACRASRRSATPACARRRPAPPSGDGERPRRPLGRRRRRGRPGAGGGGGATPGQPVTRRSSDDGRVEVDEETLERRRGRERKGRPVGRYLMCVHVRPGRHPDRRARGPRLIEHYVSSRPTTSARSTATSTSAGCRTCCPGMEAAFVDIGTPKNAVLYRGDVQYDAEDIVEKGANAAHRADAEGPADDRLPGHEEPDRRQGRPAHAGGVAARAVRGAHPQHRAPTASRSASPTTSASGCARILDEVKPAAARRDRAHRGRERHRRGARARRRPARRSSGSRSRRWPSAGRRRRCSTASPTWRCGSSARSSTSEYRGVVIDDPALFEEVQRLRAQASAPRSPTGWSTTTPSPKALPLFERYHIHEQLHKALDRKVWLPSGGSLIIEHTEALTVIDVNTGKNVGTSSLEETVFRNNLEAAEEIARQLRLRDIGGIIVIDFIDMEIRENRDDVVARLPRRAGPGQDPHAGVRHLRARPGRDDPQAHRRGPARVVRRDVPPLRGPRRPRRPRRSSSSRALRRADSAGFRARSGSRRPPMYAVIPPVASRRRSPRASASTSSCSASTTASRSTFTPGSAGRRRHACSPRLTSCQGASVDGPRRRRGQGPEDHRLHLQEQEPNQRALGPPPALRHHRDHLDHEGLGADDVEDQGRRFHPQRARLQRAAPRREGVRRHGRDRRHDHRAPARHAVPSGRERRHGRRRHALRHSSTAR